EYRLLPPAQEFFQRQFPTVLDAQRRNIQIALLTQFQPQKSDIDVTSSPGLCVVQAYRYVAH
ncbi:MAG: hypothetical protein WCA35_23370, partial [Kovacikia sp.]